MITAFCALLDRGSAAVSETACREWLGPAFEAFCTAGFLCFDPSLNRVLCAACFEQHWLPVEWDDLAQRPIARCPVNGAFFVDDVDRRMVVADSVRCLEALQLAVLGRQHRIRELVPDKAWYLGIAECGDIDWNVICVPGELTGPELAHLAEESARLPQFMLHVALTGSSDCWSALPLYRPLHAIPLAEITDWSESGIAVRSVNLRRWLQGFQSGRAKPAGKSRPSPSKGKWLHDNWRRFEAELRAQPTDSDRAKLLNAAYSRDKGGGTISRNTIVKLLAEVMPDRVRNCQ